MTEQQEKWYRQIWFVIVALLTIGPFAFPLLWKSSKFSLGMKWMLTILFLLLTVVTIWLSIESAKLVLKQIEELRSVLY